MTEAAPRVLLLTASYGSGHTGVAETLAEELRAAGAVPTVVDHFRELVHPRFDEWSRELYYVILKEAPALWGGAYWLGDRLSVSSPFLLGFNRIGARKLRRLLRAERFDHVISVHPAPAAALSHLSGRGEDVPPHTTIFTDFVAHTQWIHPHVDHYCVPAEEMANELTAKGLPRDGVSVTGIPVGREFSQLAERAAARLQLGLSPRQPVLLFMDGSEGGFGKLEDAARTVLAMEQPFQSIFVAGHQRVDNVRQLMAAADFLVTKAGGLTLAEALAAELPVICFGSLPGQESRNERFAAMAGVALVAGSEAQLQRVIGAALRDPGLLRSIRERIRLYRRPRAAEHIVDLILGGRAIRRERAS